MPLEYKENKSLNDFAEEVTEVATDHGWWENPPSIPEIIALCHAELSEALEEYRKGKGAGEIYIDEKGAAQGIPIELADVMLRILDFCGHEKIDIEGAILRKHEYNKKRPYKHGGKVI